MNVDCNEKFLNLRQVVADEFLIYCRVFDEIMGRLEKVQDEAGAARLLSKVRSATKELRKFQKGVLNSQSQKRVLKRSHLKKG